MSETVESLILDLIEWVARKEHTYEQTLAAWRTSCPRLPVWEEATDRGLLESKMVDDRKVMCPTAAALSLLNEHRPQTFVEVSKHPL